MEEQSQAKHRSIPFNIPYRSEKEILYLEEAIQSNALSGNGIFTQKCQQYFEEKYGFAKCFLTHSCTGALEMAALLLDIQPGDEIIIPSYTFVTSASAFVLRGATIRFCDSLTDNPNINPQEIRRLLTPKTKAVVIVHYAGIACDMDAIMDIVNEYGIYLIEDAAHTIDAYHGERALGGFGHLSTFSFHNTKNISAGEGGMLVINDERLIEKAEIIWEKGTNRAAFFRGEINRYEWMMLGSSFSPSELVAAYLWSQLEDADIIVSARLNIWDRYYNQLKPLRDAGKLFYPDVPDYADHNAHIFYFICNNAEERSELIAFLRKRNIKTTSHYLPLHLSPYFKDKHQGKELPNSIRFCYQLIRLPLFPYLEESEQEYVIQSIFDFYE